MNIVLGASGQIGSRVVNELALLGEPVRAVVRDSSKAKIPRNVEVKSVDFYNLDALKSALAGGTSVFLITPENPSSVDVLGETRTILDHYRQAIISSGISRIVGLSSIGAQHKSGTGNLQMSYLLEHYFQDLSVEQIFIRPAYYLSNWLGYLDMVKKEGVLPTFFPVEQKIHMVAPPDVAAFIAALLSRHHEEAQIVELTGPAEYSSLDVARTFSQILERKVEAYQIPEADWDSTLKGVGFTEDAASNMIDMIRAVINGKAVPENAGSGLVKMKTDMLTYFRENFF